MKSLLLSVSVLICISVIQSANAQVATYTQEVFNASIPFNGATPDRRVTTTDWFQSKVSGTAGAPNDFEWVNAGANPVVANQNIAGFPAGAGFVRYINRTVAYPAVSGAPTGDAAFLASRALDFSNHTVFSATADTIGISIWRDNTALPINVLDYIEVYLNTKPDLFGATLLSTTAAVTRINRSSTQTPVAALPGNWNRYQFRIPNLPQFVSAGGGSSSVYVIVKAVSAGGNNIFFDNYNMPQWTTAMTIQSAQLIYQENTNIGRNSQNNLLLGVRVTTKGSTAPLKLDAATFSLSSSTDWPNDVLNSYCYYTAGTDNYMSTAAGAVSMPLLGAGPLAGTLNFGWWSVVCSFPTATPVTMNLNPGSDNYFWLIVDVKGTATPGNYIGAELQFITNVTSLSVCNFYGNGVSSANLVTTPIPGQTFGKARLVETSYNIPSYVYGCSFNGYNQNDFISAVFMPGDNFTQIQNYDHDVTCAACLVTSGTPAHCIRVPDHPNDYTRFDPVNVSTFKNRRVQVTTGYGVRGSGSSYTLKVQAGEWASNSNNIAVFIDWNNDGDFDDTYNGPGGLISENYGTHTMLNGDLTNYPVTIWPINTTWNINVPTASDIVTDLNDATQLPNNSTGPVFPGNVRMRIREVFGVNPINPFLNSYIYGETEDYTIEVLDACPPNSTFNICKWIGSTSAWSDSSNWCPTTPTINDVAYIPVLNAAFKYPVIGSNTTAKCRLLKIMDNGAGTGAQVNIDAPQNGKLIVADDVIIGQGAPVAGSTANINVTGSFQKTQTIPSKTSVPPAGVALLQPTPFRINAQQKTQIAYTATELATTYGWKAGDIIDQISIEVNSIPGGAGASTYGTALGGFRIQAYLTSAIITYPNPVPANTKIAVAAGDPNVVAGWPRIIYGPTILTLNMPQAVNGTQAGGNYYTFNLIPNTFVWDGLSNLVLEFCTWTWGVAPSKNYILYDEASTSFNVLSINGSLSSAGPITGYTIDGAGHYAGGTSATVTATTWQFRPRLDFAFHRPYSKADIIVGGNWINNNKGTFAPSIVTGSAGFRAGYSKVVFDPVAALRSTVNSPGLTSVNVWNPIAQPASLAALTDIDQNITSQLSTAPIVSTVFNQLEINKVSATGKVVKQNSTFASTVGDYADSLALTNGELNLNRKTFTLQNSSAAYLARTNGWLRSEDNSGPLAGTMQSIFTWKIGTGTTGTYNFPFKGASTNVFNFTYNKTIAANDVGDLSIATYGTPPNNTPYTFPLLPLGNPLRVNGMTAQSSLLDCTPWTVDRFWYVKITNITILAVGETFRFEYDPVEGTLLANYVSGEMKAQRFELTGAIPGWHSPYPGQTDGISGSNRFVQLSADQLDFSYNIWAITNLNNGQPPLGEFPWSLPVELISFTANATENKQVLCKWTTATEINNDYFTVERSKDGTEFEEAGKVKGAGNSTIVLNYSFIDEHPYPGVSYYRLKQTDFDARFSYSDVIAVNINRSSGKELFVYPIPASNHLAVQFNSCSQWLYSLQLIDALGRVVLEKKGNATQDENLIDMNVAPLAKGIYNLQLITNDEAQQTRVVIQ